VTYMLLAPEKLKALAEETLVAIKERRALMRKHQIHNAVKYINGRWWRRLSQMLFGTKSLMTEEKYVELASKRMDVWNEPLWRIENRFFQEDVELAQKLIKMAELTTEAIHVSFEDMEHLWHWIK
jgi:hypothetical protein